MPTPAITPAPAMPGPDRPTTLEQDTQNLFNWLAGDLVPDVNALGAYLLAAASPAVSVAYLFDASSTADSDPGTPYLKLNNATQASATYAYADLVDRFGATVTAIIDSMDDSTSATKGWLRLQTEGDATRWILFSINGSVVTATGYRKIPLTFVAASVNALEDEAEIRAIFTANADKGDTGATGSPGPHAIYQEQRASGTASSTPNVAGADNVCALNTEVHDSLGIFSISGSTVTISQAGTYFLEGEVWARGVGGLRAMIYDVTGGAVVGNGDSRYAEDYGSSVYFSSASTGRAIVVLTGSRNFQLRVYTASPVSGAYGVSVVGDGRTNVYSTLKITKVA